MKGFGKIDIDFKINKKKELKASKEGGIYIWWDWWDIKENIVKIINQDNYSTNIGDIWIKQKRKIKKDKKNSITEVFYTWDFFIVQESSRWSSLHIKRILKKAMHLFDKDIILKSFVNGWYRNYTLSKQIEKEIKEKVKYNDCNSIYKTIGEYDYRIIYDKEKNKVQVFEIKTDDIWDKKELYVNDDNLSKIKEFSEKTLILVDEIISYLWIIWKIYVAYYWTQEEIDDFEVSSWWVYWDWIYFTWDKEYAKNVWTYDKKNYITKARIFFSNPLVINNYSGFDINYFFNEFKKEKQKNKNTTFKKWIESKWYDGIIIKEDDNKPFILYNKNQIIDIIYKNKEDIIEKLCKDENNTVIRKLYWYWYVYKVLNGKNISFYDSQNEKIEKDVEEMEKEWNEFKSQEELYFKDFWWFWQILLNKENVIVYKVKWWTHLILNWKKQAIDFLNYNYIEDTPFFTLDEKTTNWTCLYNIKWEFIDYIKEGSLKIFKNNKIRYNPKFWKNRKELEFNNFKQWQNNK